MWSLGPSLKTRRMGSTGHGGRRGWRVTWGENSPKALLAILPRGVDLDAPASVISRDAHVFQQGLCSKEDPSRGGERECGHRHSPAGLPQSPCPCREGTSTGTGRKRFSPASGPGCKGSRRPPPVLVERFCRARETRQAEVRARIPQLGRTSGQATSFPARFSVERTILLIRPCFPPPPLNREHPLLLLFP